MSELHDLLERQASGYEPPDDLLARVRERGRRRRRARRVGSALAVLVLTAITAGGLYRALTPTSTVLFDQPADPLVGTWVSTDTDGSYQTMDIRASDGVYEVVVDDDGASVCAGAPSTMTGTGQLDDAGLIVPAPVLVCDDGSTPVPLDGSSLEEAVRNYTLVHDAATDTLTDNLGVEWRRPTASPDVAEIEAPAASGYWPQSNLDEVREAQRRADAGDPVYAWQLSPLEEAGFPGDAEIFHVFLKEELGWEQFRWGAEPMGYDHFEGSYDVRFVRCAAGQTNPLYPNEPQGVFGTLANDRGCAPTLDEFTYETVEVSLYQPLRDDEDGIWVIRGWQRQPSVRQTAPPSDEEVAGIVEPFLQARVAGEGGQQYLEATSEEIALLYATSTGARYERFDYEVGDAEWPGGDLDVTVRLFAGGGTVVEQTFHLDRASRKLEYSEMTTENGAPAAEPYLLGPVTFLIPESWPGVLFPPHGEDMVARYNQAGDHDHQVVVVLDPLPPTGRCGWGDQSAAADELVNSIRSSRNLSVSAPVAARVGAIDALRLDVTAASEAVPCGDGEATVLAPRHDPEDANDPSRASVGPNEQVRLYVFDTPGPRARTVAILITAPKPAFDRVLKAAEPIIESFELNTD